MLRSFSAHVLTTLVLLSLGSLFAHAQEVKKAPTPRTVTLQIQGEIKPDLIQKVKDALAMTTGDPLPAGLIVLLNSQGGDGLAAIEVGRLLRQADAHVFVTGKCASACVFILMGGVVRQAPELSIGIHRARLTKLDKDGKRIEVDASANPSAAKFLERSNQKLRIFTQEMGMSEEFYRLMEATPVDKLKWLSRAQSRSLGIIGFEPEYMKRREKYLIEMYKIKAGDLERNTNRILDYCLDEVKKPSGNFTRCYRLNLDRPIDNQEFIKIEHSER